MPYNRERPDISPYQDGDYDDNGYYKNSWLASMERDGPGVHDFDSDYSSERTGTFKKNTSRNSVTSSRRLKKKGSFRNGDTGKPSPLTVEPDPPTLPRRTLRGQTPQSRRPPPARKNNVNNKTWLLGIFVSLSCTSICVILLSTAFGTNEWINTVVDRETLSALAKDDANLRRYLKTEDIYRSSNRGLFKTCYKEVPSDNLLYKCVGEQGYALSRTFSRLTWGAEYDEYNHIMRLVFISLVLALVFCLITIVVIVSGCMRASRRMLIIGIAQAFFAFLFIIGAMGSFHGVDNYETDRLLHEPYPADWPNSHKKLAVHYTRNFGYSYFLGWVSATLSIVSVASLILSYISLGKFKALNPKRKKENIYANQRGGGVSNISGTLRSSKISDEADTYYTTSSHASRNFAYEMVEKNVPPPDELDCIDEIMFEDRGSTKL